MSRCSRESYGKTKKSLLEQLKKEKQKSEEYLKQLKYLQADFENYRKRIEKEIQDLAIRSNEKMVANLLNVIDDLERALEAREAGTTARREVGPGTIRRSTSPDHQA